MSLARDERMNETFDEKNEEISLSQDEEFPTINPKSPHVDDDIVDNAYDQ